MTQREDNRLIIGVAYALVGACIFALGMETQHAITVSMRESAGAQAARKELLQMMEEAVRPQSGMPGTSCTPTSFVAPKRANVVA